MPDLLRRDDRAVAGAGGRSPPARRRHRRANNKMAKVTVAPPTAALLLAEDPSWAPYRARDELVPDRFWLAYFILYLMGVASLLPWNALITPVEYLKLRAHGSPFENSMESVLSIMFTSISFLTLLLLQR